MTEPQPLFDAIGRVIAEAALVDHAYASLVAVLEGRPPTSPSTMGEPPVRLKKRAAGALSVGGLPREWRTRCTETMATALDLLQQRNIVAHGLWLTRIRADGNTVHTSHKPKHGGGLEEKDWDHVELLLLAHRLDLIGFRLYLLVRIVDTLQQAPPNDGYSLLLSWIEDDEDIPSGHLDALREWVQQSQG